VNVVVASQPRERKKKKTVIKQFTDHQLEAIRPFDDTEPIAGDPPHDDDRTPESLVRKLGVLKPGSRLYVAATST
jgi:hypothetical protein